MPRPTKPLFFHEEIMLLALREEKGTMIQGPSYCLAIGGAIVADLLTAGRISVEAGRKKLINLESKKPLGDPVIDECLERIATANRRAALQTWLERFSKLKRLKHRVAEGLCDRGILRADQDKILLLFTRNIYPERDPKPEREIIERLRRAIFTETRGVDPRTVVLLSLASSADILKIPFDKRKLKGRKKRIEELTSGNLLGEATKEAVQAAQAAAAMVAIMPAITVAAISN